MRRVVGGLGAIAIAALTMGAGMAGAPAPAAPGLRMTVGTLGTIGSLDPRRGDSPVAREVWNIQYPTLATLDAETLRPVPGVATAWTPLPHDRGWRYALRQGLTWSDGTPVTATDVVYSFDHARDDHWPYAQHTLNGLSGLDARAVNPHTVDVTARTASLSSADNELPGLLLHVVPAHVYAKTADLDRNPAALGIADGAWHVTATSPDEVRLGVLGRPAGPPLDQIVFRTYPDADGLIAALDHAQVDVVSGVPDADVGRLENMADVTVNHAPDGTAYVLRFTSSFTDARLRGVVERAIDGPALVAAAVDGVGTPIAPAAQPEQARRELAAIPGSLVQPTLVVPDDTTGRRVGDDIRRSLARIGLPTNVVHLGVDEKARVHSDLVIERVDARHQPADSFGLFEPDVLQAFRSDNVTGFLREPSQRALVVFGPAASQYGGIVATGRPPGEQLSNLTYALAAAVLLAGFAVVYWFFSRLRRRYAT